MENNLIEKNNQTQLHDNKLQFELINDQCILYNNRTNEDNSTLINFTNCNNNNNSTNSNNNNNNNINNESTNHYKKNQKRNELNQSVLCDNKRSFNYFNISLNSWQLKKPFRWQSIKRLRKQLYLLLILILVVLMVNYSLNYLEEINEAKFRLRNINSHVPGMKDYLVWSEGCKMPNLDPYLPEVMKHFKREKYKPCENIAPLTYVEFNDANKQYLLRIDEQYIKQYNKTKSINCCYQIIKRNGTGDNIDKKVSLSECLNFRDKHPMAPTIDNIIVRCYSNSKEVYVNGHPMMPERLNIRKRLKFWSKYDRQFQRKKPPNVLMLGIDSISRLNLIRAMPKTAQYLYDNEWFELSGYNKIDDNTFPNLMAILTGLNKTEALKRCKPTILGGLDNCDFLWHTFRRYGYVTAYAEDEAEINTFNFLKMGFKQPPTDYYLRPFLLSAEKELKISYKSNLIYCLGYQHSADYVYEYALELAKRYRNDTYFGLFWTNTFSHNNIIDCTSMDGRMVQYLKRLVKFRILDDTIIIFFSDHGMRYGLIRQTYSGHLEERLPFMFIWLPQQFKHQYPSFASALKINKNRLTNPYDLHMTLKHIVNLTGRQNVSTNASQSPTVKSALACPNCHSLLKPVFQNRSCEDVAIEAHWCTCLHYESINTNSKIVLRLGNLLINFINNFVANYYRNETKLCKPLKLNYIKSAYLSHANKTMTSANHHDIYRVLFYTKKNNALFEATVQYNVHTDNMKVTGEISRLNSYIEDSKCVLDGAAKKYCSCYT